MSVRGVAIAILTSFAFAACSAGDANKVVVASGAFPSIAIECRSAIPLPEYLCREWAEKLLSGSEELLPRTARLVLTTNAERNGRCAADFFDSAGRIFASASTRCPLS